MVAMVDRLVKAGFVVRQPCQTDRRINRVVLTEAGNRAVRRPSKPRLPPCAASFWRTIDPAEPARLPPSCSRRCKD